MSSKHGSVDQSQLQYQRDVAERERINQPDLGQGVTTMGKGIHQPINVPVDEDGLRQIETDLAMESQVTGVRRDYGGNWARSHVPALIAEIRRLRGDTKAVAATN